MATTANKNCKQFIGIVTGDDGITARSGDEPGKGTVKLKTAEINESESTSSETVYQISETGSTDVEVYNYTEMAFAKDEEVEIWQDGYGVFWVTPTKDNRDFFVIKSSDYNIVSYAKKGGVFHIQRGAYGLNSTPAWVIRTNNTNDCRLAICQEDMPDDYFDNPLNLYYLMPYYTPEMNYGVVPNGIAWHAHTTSNIHCGVVNGEYAFSTKKLNYTFSNGIYTYTPQFMYTGAAVNLNNSVGISIEGHTYPVQFPNYTTTARNSLTCYPDVYAGDIITVLVEETQGQISGEYTATVKAVNYPMDFEKGFSMVVENSTLLGRGWDEEYIQGTDFKFAWKIQGNALT